MEINQFFQFFLYQINQAKKREKGEGSMRVCPFLRADGNPVPEGSTFLEQEEAFHLVPALVLVPVINQRDGAYRKTASFQHKQTLIACSRGNIVSLNIIYPMDLIH
jgi:hypothetical protein